MLESTLQSSIIYYIMGAITIGGMASKLIASVALKKLVQAASDMSKSTHAFMKLVRAKFEHACMINDQVDNIDVFVDKYIHEYHVWGLRLYSWQRMERICAVLLVIYTLYLSGVTYYYEGFSQLMFQNVMIGAGLFVLLLGIYQLVDEKFRLQTMKVYMIDYLENVAARRYVRGGVLREKSSNPSVLEQNREDRNFADKLEEQMANIELKQRMMGQSAPEEVDKPDFEQPVTQQVAEQMAIRVKEKKALQLRAQEEAEKRQELKKQKQEEFMPNEATIREILQEFMA